MNEGSTKESYVAARVHRALDSAGVHMMDNRVERLHAAGADSASAPPLYLIGIGDRWAKNDRDSSTFAAIPNGVPRLVFMHDPDSFAEIPAGDAPVAIAAHTHGMQLGIPFVSDWLWRHKFSDKGSGVEGWIDHYGQPGNRLYVNRGVGFSIIPARVNAVPELTVFTLTRADSTRATAPSLTPH
jgi:predicted MPP superfamily phosphohydrolase